jgi:hypothetical protein
VVNYLPSKQKIRVRFSLSALKHSKGFVVQLVEHTAHNGKNVSSTLTKPMKKVGFEPT